MLDVRRAVPPQMPMRRFGCAAPAVRCPGPYVQWGPAGPAAPATQRQSSPANRAGTKQQAASGQLPWGDRAIAGCPRRVRAVGGELLQHGNRVLLPAWRFGAIRKKIDSSRREIQGRSVDASAQSAQVERRICWRNAFCRSPGVRDRIASPDFTLFANKNKRMTLSDWRGKWVVFWWYPEANSGGCSLQAVSLHENLDAIQFDQIVVLGASFNTVSQNDEFACDKQLRMRLLSDPEQVVGKAYEVIRSPNEPFSTKPRR